MFEHRNAVEAHRPAFLRKTSGVLFAGLLGIVGCSHHEYPQSADKPQTSTTSTSTSTSLSSVDQSNLYSFGLSTEQVNDILGAKTSASLVNHELIESAMGRCIVAKSNVKVPGAENGSLVIIQNPVVAEATLTDQATNARVYAKIWGAVLPQPIVEGQDPKHGVYTDIEVNGSLEFGVWGNVPGDNLLQLFVQLQLARDGNEPRPDSETSSMFAEHGGLAQLEPAPSFEQIPGQLYWIPDTQMNRVNDYCELTAQNQAVLGLQESSAPRMPEV